MIFFRPGTTEESFRCVCGHRWAEHWCDGPDDDGEDVWGCASGCSCPCPTEDGEDDDGAGPVRPDEEPA